MNNIHYMTSFEGGYCSAESYRSIGGSRGPLNIPAESKGPAAMKNPPAAEIDSVAECRQQNALLHQQSLKYAEDMARVYEEERLRRKALEATNRELKAEIQARVEAEKALKEIQQDLEKRVFERTDALSAANRQLQLEIARREETEEQIRGSLREKEVLLSEVHHRVKNNLQVISSLLALQCDRVSDESVRGALMDSQGRIRSMALIHEQLYQSGDLSKIDFSRHVGDLAQAMQKSLADRAASVHIQTDVDRVLLPVGLALPCSLIINELVTNCLKHAFPDERCGEVRIDFHKRNGNRYGLTVSDNGIGLPEDLDWRYAQSLGLRLVVNLAEIQLRGKLEIDRNEGTTFRIEFSGPEED